jgi:hypothetical protein
LWRAGAFSSLEASMLLQVLNQGDKTVRVIIDGDTVNDEKLEPGDTSVIETVDEGKVEFREMGA